MKKILALLVLVVFLTGCKSTPAFNEPIQPSASALSTKYPNAIQVSVEEAASTRDKLLGKVIMFEGDPTTIVPYQIGEKREFGYIEFPECIGTSCNLSTWIGKVELRDALLCSYEGNKNATKCPYPRGAKLRIVGSWETSQSGSTTIYTFKTLDYEIFYPVVQ